jgi:hypothetical protein
MANGWVARRGDRRRLATGIPSSGRSIRRRFDRTVDAQRWLRQEVAKVDAAKWVDSSAGAETLEVFFESWAARQVRASNTHVAMSLAVRKTPFRSIELGKIRTTHIETWIKSVTVPSEKRAALVPGTIKTRFVNVRSVFGQRSGIE